MSKEAQALLDEAEKLMKNGDVEGAVRRAKRALGVGDQKHQLPIHAFLTRAYCKKRDLTQAKAHGQHLRGGPKKRVAKYCEKFEIAID